MAWSILGNENPDVGEVTFICDEVDSPLQKILFTHYRHRRPAFIFTFRTEEEGNQFNSQLGGRGWTLPNNGIMIDSNRYSPDADDDSDDEDETDFLSVLWSISPSLENNQQLKSMLINLVNAPYSSEDKSTDTILEHWSQLINEGNYEACFYPVSDLNAPLGVFFAAKAEECDDPAEKKQLESMALKAFLLVSHYEREQFNVAKDFIFKQYLKGNYSIDHLIEYKNEMVDQHNILLNYQLSYEVADVIATKNVNEALNILRGIPNYEALSEQEKVRPPAGYMRESFQEAYETIYRKAQQLAASLFYLSKPVQEVGKEGGLDDSEDAGIQANDFEIYTIALEHALNSKDDDTVRTLYTMQIQKYDDPESKKLLALREKNPGMLESLEAPCANYTIRSLVELTRKTISLHQVIADVEREAARELHALKAELHALKQSLKDGTSVQQEASSSSYHGRFFSLSSVESASKALDEPASKMPENKSNEI